MRRRLTGIADPGGVRVLTDELDQGHVKMAARHFGRAVPFKAELEDETYVNVCDLMLHGKFREALTRVKLEAVEMEIPNGMDWDWAMCPDPLKED